MNHRVDRRAIATGALGLAVAVALPVFAVSVANAGATAVTTHDVVEPALAAPAPRSEPARSIVYGTASETKVTVFRQVLPQDTPEVLFTYDNPEPHDRVDNQAINRPALALAPDGRAVAYLSRSGLRVRHLDTGADEVVVGQTDSLDDIAFSPDGRFLSFARYGSEGADYSVVELATGRIRPLPDAKPGVSYERVRFAPDGDHIAFTFLDRARPSPQTELAISKVDGTGFGKVAAASVTEPFVFGDEATLYAVDGRDLDPFVLVAHDLAEGESRDVATVPNVVSPLDLWLTPSGELAVVAATKDPGEGSFQQRLFLYTPDGTLLQTSRPFTSFSRLIGITFA